MPKPRHVGSRSLHVLALHATDGLQAWQRNKRTATPTKHDASLGLVRSFRNVVRCGIPTYTRCLDTKGLILWLMAINNGMTQDTKSVLWLVNYIMSAYDIGMQLVRGRAKIGTPGSNWPRNYSNCYCHTSKHEHVQIK